MIQYYRCFRLVLIVRLALNGQFRIAAKSFVFRSGLPLKAGFHQRRSRSRSRNQKGRAIRSSENQTDGVGSRTLIVLMSPLLTVKCKLHCLSGKQKRKNKPMTMFDSGLCDWLVLPLLLPTPTTQFSLDHKRRSRKRNRKKWKRSDSSYSDSVELMTLLTTMIFDFHQVMRSLMTPTPSPVKTSFSGCVFKFFLYILQPQFILKRFYCFKQTSLSLGGRISLRVAVLVLLSILQRR